MKTSKYLSTVLMLMLFSALAFSQNRGQRFDVDKFHEHKWDFIMKEVKLSPAEESAVKPVFIEYEKKNWELHVKSRELFQQARKEEMSEKDYRNLNDKTVNLEIKRAQYLREYHVKLRKLLNPETLYRYYRAQKSFEKQLLMRGPGMGTPPQSPGNTGSGKRRGR